MGLEELTERRIGYIYSEDGVYHPDEITFTVELGARVEIGDIVLIEHPSKLGVPVFYQVVEVPLRRRARDYEEDLVRIGRPLLDESRNYPRVRAKQLGYYEDVAKLLRGEATVDELLALIEHVRPLAPVYTPRPEVVRALLTPNAPSIPLGYVYPSWKYELRLELRKLLRQGLLIVGGVGTGKTTTMLTVLIRTIDEVKRLGGQPHIVIIDKDGEYSTPELVAVAGADNYVRVSPEAVAQLEYSSRVEYLKALMKELGYFRRTDEVKAVEGALSRVQEQVYMLTPEFVETKVLPHVDPKYRSFVAARLNQWKKRLSGYPSSNMYTLTDLVNLAKSKTVLHIDLSATTDFDKAFSVLSEFLRNLYTEALMDSGFGCIVAIDEAHLYAPERDHTVHSDPEAQPGYRRPSRPRWGRT